MITKESEGGIVYCSAYCLEEDGEAEDNASSWPVVLRVYGRKHCLIYDPATGKRFRETLKIYSTEDEAYFFALDKIAQSKGA